MRAHDDNFDDNQQHNGAVIEDDWPEIDVSTQRHYRVNGLSDFLSRLKDPDVKAKKWTITAALLLLIVGTVLLGFGAHSFIYNTLSGSNTIPLLVVGCICFIPGIYQTTLFIKIMLDSPGYSFDQMPSYD
eukprot:TRINITY_DN2419_c0_g1_i2.p1 TRINITY_DN2419_c0_g1~~TRINITY_DN2419_c0_g1_i2.p1  ORF type:complete len:130 (-),score=11.98 TRINITY_DN2419_c0_g1_i2:158-547(-)